MKLVYILSMLLSLTVILSRYEALAERFENLQVLAAKQSLKEAMPYIDFNDQEIRDVIKEMSSKSQRDSQEELMLDTLKKLLREREILKLSQAELSPSL